MVGTEGVRRVSRENDGLRGLKRFGKKRVRSQPLPAYGETAYYGLTLRQLNDNWVLQWKGESLRQNVKTRLDLFLDRQVRKFDYHFAQNPQKLLVRRPKQFVETLRTPPKASRGTAKAVWSEIVRFQLTHVYQPYLHKGDIT